MSDFSAVTELAGADVSREQILRAINRYSWAATYCAGRDVLEVACGAGIGLGLIGRQARSLQAGDYTPALLDMARRHYGDKFPLHQLDAQSLPFADDSFDVVLIVEALYYVPRPEAFFAEARRVLRPGGRLLIVTTNKDLFDFHPSPFSQTYHGVTELADALGAEGFAVELFGDTPATKSSALQRVTRPLKWLAVRLNLMPKTMNGKKLLKRLLFGGLTPMPAELTPRHGDPVTPQPLPTDRPDRIHKILFCAATLPPILSH